MPEGYLIKRGIAPILFFIFGSIIYQSCAPSISLYSESAYRHAIELKVSSLDLMNYATEPPENHIKAIHELRLELQTAYEFANGRPDNEYSADLWQIMVDPDEEMMGGFLKLWEENGAMSEYFVTLAKENIAEGFDLIIGLESGKIRPGSR